MSISSYLWLITSNLQIPLSDDLYLRILFYANNKIYSIISYWEKRMQKFKQPLKQFFLAYAFSLWTIIVNDSSTGNVKNKIRSVFVPVRSIGSGVWLHFVQRSLWMIRGWKQYLSANRPRRPCKVKRWKFGFVLARDTNTVWYL